MADGPWLEEEEAAAIAWSSEAALALATNSLEPPRPVGIRMVSAERLQFRRILFDLDGCLVDTHELSLDDRLHGNPRRWLEISRCCPGIPGLLNDLFQIGGLEVVLATNAPAKYAETLVRHHFPDFADRLLAKMVASAGKPKPFRLRPHVDDGPAETVLLVGDRIEDFLAAHALGVRSAVLVSGTQDVTHALNAGPDLVIPSPEAFLAALMDYRTFLYPLEPEGLAPDQRLAPLTIRRQGRDWIALARYRPTRRWSPMGSLLDQSSRRVLDFKRTGIGADLIAAYIDLHFPTTPVVLIPGRATGGSRGLGVLQDALARLGHPGTFGLEWAQVPPVRQKDAGSLEGRRQNVKGAFRAVDGASLNGTQVLLIDDVITSGATLDEAQRTLEAAGARVTALALAHTVWDRDWEGSQI